MSKDWTGSRTDALAAFDGRKSQVAELRFFGGLSLEETGHVLGISVATVEREWQAARAWLYLVSRSLSMTPERWRRSSKSSMWRAIVIRRAAKPLSPKHAATTRRCGRRSRQCWSGSIALVSLGRPHCLHRLHGPSRVSARRPPAGARLPSRVRIRSQSL